MNAFSKIMKEANSMAEPSMVIPVNHDLGNQAQAVHSKGATRNATGKPVNLAADELYIVHYCHPSCEPLLNICRMSKEEAFLQASKMASDNPDTTAFYRFADFENYYPRRMMQDEYLYDLFVSLGGKPKENHPLSFVLQCSEYLKNWFDNDITIKIRLKDIPSEHISFTLGDSGELTKKNGVMVKEIQKGKLTMYTKEILLKKISEHDGTVEDFLCEITEKYNYIEVQLWSDDYCRQIKKCS